MISGWLNFWRGRSNWILFLIAFIAQYGFSRVFLLGENSAWGKAVEGAGGITPEEQFGFLPNEPMRSIEILHNNNAVGDYATWQLIDFPFAVLNVVAITAAISLFLRKANLQHSALRFLLFLPIIYFFAELIENSLVASFALKAISPTSIPVIIQQTATSIKLLAGNGGLIIGLLGVAGAALIQLLAILKSLLNRGAS